MYGVETCIQVTFKSLQEMGLSRKEAYRLITTKNPYVSRFANKYYALRSDIEKLIAKEQKEENKNEH